MLVEKLSRIRMQRIQRVHIELNVIHVFLRIFYLLHVR